MIFDITEAGCISMILKNSQHRFYDMGRFKALVVMSHAYTVLSRLWKDNGI